MFQAYNYHNGRVKEGGLENLKTKASIWVDAQNPTKNELKILADSSGINIMDIREAIDEAERPKLIDLDEYSLIVVRAPLVEKEEVSTTSIAIFVSKTKNNVITVRKKDIAGINKIKTIITENRVTLFDKGLSHFVYRLLDEIINNYFAIMDVIEANIDKIEDKVFGHPDKKTVEEIFETKKTLIYFFKALVANREVLSAVEKEYAVHINKKDTRKFNIIYNDVVQLIDMVSTFRDILTGTLDTYLSSVSNNLNIVMKKITAYGALILVPTLISGVYGMNFKWMPELSWKYGYFFAMGLMIVSVFILFILFKKKDWI